MEFSSIALPAAYMIPPLPLTSHHYRIYPSTQVTHLVLVWTYLDAPEAVYTLANILFANQFANTMFV